MLGDKIRELRKRNKLTQQDLAKAISLSRSAVGMLESNKNGASPDKLKEIADLFDVTVDYLLSDNEQIESSMEIKKERDYSLSIKEQENIDDEAKKIIEELSISFSKNKDSLNEEDYFAIENAIRTTLEAIKIKNKKKFTPKKYK
ncbi:helix-turn-helix transcriptional regulator [Clostridium sp.]|uniref:helix-turn-helix domain-containing protein n=1 Tax=Clostridium sp. TaxID=1506 RepID=UPI00260ECD2E|nr:helix-turn-helix transcriptional regulator [Clostridium sp.]